MDEVLQFLQENPVFFIATDDGGKPRVRPFGFVMKYKGALCFCTGNGKNVYRQLRANPEFQIAAVAKDGGWLRLTSRAEFITTEEARQAAFGTMPSLRDLYSGKESSFEVFCARGGEAVFTGADGKMKTVRL